MSSLVLDLQQEVLKPDCDILSVLRKAHLIAVKLKLTEFDEWIQLELKGYSNKKREEIPKYRNVKGTLKVFNPYHGWVPALCPDDKLEKRVCEQKMWHSIGELQELYQQSSGHSFVFQFPAGQTEALSVLFNTPIPMQFALHISTHLLKSIIEQVKNCVLEWTITLEENGILGENMTFNEKESESARDIPQQINNYYGNVVQGNVSSSQIVSGDANTVTYNATAVSDAVQEIRESLSKEEISAGDMKDALEILDDISDKLEQNKKSSIIKSALVGLKDFVLAAGANVTAALITAKLQGLF